jgi:chromatin structure-remodeling complex subunit RSC1/2
MCLAKHFNLDPDMNEVLWFSSPPTNMVQVVKRRHSLAYLHVLAMKRKREVGDIEGHDEMDVDGEKMKSCASNDD